MSAMKSEGNHESLVLEEPTKSKEGGKVEISIQSIDNSEPVDMLDEYWEEEAAKIDEVK